MTIASMGGQATDSLNGKLTFEQDKNRIVGRDANNIARLLILADGSDFVMKVSKEGLDVLTADNDDLIFNSSQDILKVVVSSTASQPIASLAQDATNTLTVAHNLGYVPAALVYLNGTGSSYLTAGKYYPPTTSIPIKIGATYYPGIIYSYHVDATNIYFTVENRSPLTPITDIGTANWKYYLQQETAN